MKVLNLDSYISEKKSIKPLTIKQIKDFDLPNYYPETKDELREIIYKRMKKEGNECDLNDIDVSSITDMSYLFSDFDKNNNFITKNNISDFNGDISKWDVSNVTDMSCMFYDAESFNGDISGWNVSKVEDMSYMFGGAFSFNGDISGWDISNVEDMSGMFQNAESFNRDISGWNVSKVEYMSYMFDDCPIGNYPEKQPKFNKHKIK